VFDRSYTKHNKRETKIILSWDLKKHENQKGKINKGEVRKEEKTKRERRQHNNSNMCIGAKNVGI